MKLPELENQTELLHKVAQGDKAAFTRIYNHYSPRIHHASLKLLRSEAEAEGAVQEVFLKIWKGREKLIDIESFADYLFIITRNLIYSRFKRKALELKITEALSATSSQTVNNTDMPIIEKEYAALLGKVVGQLPPQQKQIFYLAREEGRSHQEIADLLNLSRLTVKKHMALALKTIRTNLKKQIEFP